MSATFTLETGAVVWTLDGGPSTALIAFAPFNPHGVPTSAVSLSDTWSTYPGTYLVLPPGTALGTTLAQSLASFLAWRTPASIRFAWIANPTADPRSWSACTLGFAGEATSGSNGIVLRNLALWIGGGCAAAPDSPGDAIVLATEPGRVTLTSEFGAASFQSTTATLTIPFSGPQAGCVVTGVTLAESDGVGASSCSTSGCASSRRRPARHP